MGCASSHKSVGSDRIQTHHIDIPLSTVQKFLVRETWETIEAHKNPVGKNTFLRFFEMNPGYQKLFPEFVGLNREELQKANALHGHAKRVMKAVENAVTSMDDAESFSAYLEGLGGRHVNRALKPSNLDAMQEALMETLKELLQTQWTQETAEAWNILFSFIADMMKRGLQSAKKLK